MSSICIKCLLLIGTVFLLFPVTADADDHDAIYLKDSTIVRGYIIEDKPDIHIKILTIEDTLATIPYELIEGVNEETEERLGISEYGKSYKWFHGGISGKTGLLFHSGGEANLSVGILTTRNISPYAIAGIGFDFTDYEFSDLWSVYGTVKLAMTDEVITPYVFGDLGYSFESSNLKAKLMETGLVYDLGVGVEFYRTSSICFNLEVFRKTQHLSLAVRESIKYPHSSKYYKDRSMGLWGVVASISL